MGEEVKQLEAELSTFTGTKHAITCSSGTDALLLALMAMDIQPSDEIITTPFTFVSTAETIASMKAKPVFVDVLEDQNMDPAKLESAITERTKAIMPVHLTGRMCEMDEIMRIADLHSIPVVEDAAQSIGSQYNSRPSGSIGKLWYNLKIAKVAFYYCHTFEILR